MHSIAEATETDPLNYVGIPDFGGGLSDMAANDVSADGTILVGTGNVKTGPVAFLADMTTATVDETTGETVVEPVQLIITEVTETGKDRHCRPVRPRPWWSRQR